MPVYPIVYIDRDFSPLPFPPFLHSYQPPHGLLNISLVTGWFSDVLHHFISVKWATDFLQYELDHVISNQSQFESAGSCDLQPIILPSLCHVTVLRPHKNTTYSAIVLLWSILSVVSLWSNYSFEMWLKQINWQSDWVTTKVPKVPTCMFVPWGYFVPIDE